MGQQVNKRPVPVAWGLLLGKSCHIYAKFLEIVLFDINFVDGGPTTALIDFEKSMIIEVGLAFPEITIKGCNFHLKQAIQVLVAKL
jgi:hypothetical protein